MIIDNKTDWQSTGIKSVWDYITNYTNPNRRQGKLDIVTGFFSIAGLHLLYKELNPNNQYRIVIGQMVSDDDFMERVVNLLQGDSSIENAFKLSEYAKNALEFLRHGNVELKAITKNFCHAKAYSYEDSQEDVYDYCVTGSSNLTEAGLGVRETSNVELNVAELSRQNSLVSQVKLWFRKQWEEVAKSTIAVPIDEKHFLQMDVKQFVIEQIEQLFKAYTPREIYLKILFEYFKEDVDLTESLEHQREMKFLKDTKVWNKLFDYQQSGAISLIKTLTKYNGAILADAVGLGKTFTSLAVIKYYQNQGYNVLLLCPKKLGGNWMKYTKGHLSCFEQDDFNYIVRYHTDLQDDRLDRRPDGFTLTNHIKKYPKLLVVVDESHNLRNDHSSRYKMLMKDIIAHTNGKVRDVKVLLLSATPINTSLKDVRNQFKLIAKGEDDAFAESLNTPSLESTFTLANKKYKEYCLLPANQRDVNLFKTMLPQEFFDLTGDLVVARTRRFIERRLGKDMGFPKKKDARNENQGLTQIGRYKSIAAIHSVFSSINMTAYQPTAYQYEIPKEVKGFIDRIIKKPALLQDPEFIAQFIDLDGDNKTADKIIRALQLCPEDLLPIAAKGMAVRLAIALSKNSDEVDWQNDAFREMSLASMIITMLMKRLESSWYSCLNTITSILNTHKLWKSAAEAYHDGTGSAVVSIANGKVQEYDEDADDDDDDEAMAEAKRKRKVDFREMVRLNDYIEDLGSDIKIMESFKKTLETFQKKIEKGDVVDDKIAKLAEIIREKQQTSNRKVIVFTTYSDTAEYIYKSLQKYPEFAKLACVSGSSWKVNGETTRLRDFLPIIERFAPYSKLCLEGTNGWDQVCETYGINPKDYTDPNARYEKWKSLVLPADKEIQYALDHEIDILVASDCLSEGQNMQDADMVINYDIHWNPVRLVQRFGRVDRIGSPNKEIQCVNFWPTASYKEYIDLADRISNRMTIMTLVGAEIVDIDEKTKEMVERNKILDENEQRNLDAFVNNKYEDIDQGQPDMAAISMTEYKEDLANFLAEHGNELSRIPNGAFSGFTLDAEEFKTIPESLVALVRNRIDPKKHYLLCLPVNPDNNATATSLGEQQVLTLLKSTQDKPTSPEWIKTGDVEHIKLLSQVLHNWFEQTQQSNVTDAIDDLLGVGGLESAPASTSNQTLEEALDIKEFDLIAWDYVSRTE